MVDCTGLSGIPPEVLIGFIGRPRFLGFESPVV
jgi:hypothetical protein